VLCTCAYKERILRDALIFPLQVIFIPHTPHERERERVCVCVCVCTRVWVCLYVSQRVYTCRYLCMYAHMLLRTSVYMCTQACTSGCIHTGCQILVFPFNQTNELLWITYSLNNLHYQTLIKLYETLLFYSEIMFIIHKTYIGRMKSGIGCLPN